MTPLQGLMGRGPTIPGRRAAARGTRDRPCPSL